MKLLDERTAAKIYINTKLHFEGSIDMFVRPVGAKTIDALLQRRDAYYYKKAVSEFQKVDVFFDYCVAANLIESPWIGDLVTNTDRFRPEYYRLRKVKANRPYYIRADLKTLYGDGKPLEYYHDTERIISVMQSGRINPETVVFMHRAWNVLSSDKLSPFYELRAARIAKYSSFISYKTLDEFNELVEYAVKLSSASSEQV